MNDAAKRTFEIRDAAWAFWGQVDDDVLAPRIQSGSRWPAGRQALISARRGGLILVASDGLADPFDPPEPLDVNGFELEVYALGLASEGDGWLVDLVWQASQYCAEFGDIADLIAQQDLLSAELYEVGIPDPYRQTYINDAGRVAVLLGQPTKDIPAILDGPLSSIRLVNVQLLTLDELALIRQKKAAGRRELAERFLIEGVAGHSRLTR